MKIMYNGKIVDTNDMKVLGGNFEGMVYEYNGSALKVYHQNPDKIVLPQDTCNDFTKIKTNAILMPDNLVYAYDENNQLYYRGCGTKLVKGEIPLSEMWQTLSKDKLQQQGDILYDDLETLTNNNVEISDLECLGNFIYNGNMYFCDFGNFKFSTMPNLYNSNLNALNEALHSQLILLGKSKEFLEEEFCNMTNSNLEFTEDFYNFIMKIYNDTYEENFLYLYKDYLVFLDEVSNEKNIFNCRYTF